MSQDQVKEMSAEDSSFDDDDDILPEARVFKNRADDIWNTKMEAYEKLYHQNEENMTEEELESKENDLLLNITKDQENRDKKSRSTRKGRKAPAIPPKEDPAKTPKRTSQRIKKRMDHQNDKDAQDAASYEKLKLSVSAKKRLKKMQMETERQKKQVDEETKKILSSCDFDQNFMDDIELIHDDFTERDINLKIRYMSRISKITVGHQEVFKSIFAKVAEEFKLQPSEILLCRGDKNIDLNDTPQSINIRPFEIIDCFPYKPETLNEEDNEDKLLLKIQSNDTRKKIEIHTHKLEKLEEVMKKYANLRMIPLENLIFKFDGEKIDGSETPADLDMESGSCVDAIVLNYETPPSKKVPMIDIAEEIPQSQMLNICVLD